MTENTADEYTPMTEEEINKSAEDTIARRDIIMANILAVKKAQLAKMQFILTDQKRVIANKRAKAKLKRKSSKVARRNNRSK